MKVLIIISAFLLSVAYSNVINARCDPAKFGKCMDTFAKALGLPEMPKDPSALDRQIKKILADEGQQGQVKVCKAAESLQSCLGDQYDACINVEFLKSIGHTQAEAEQFVALAKQLEKTCLPLTMLVSTNAKCDPARFDKCTDSFAKALGLPEMPTDPNVLAQKIKELEAQGEQGKIKVCKAAENLQSCLADQYDACINVDFLKSIGESQKDAEQFVYLAKKLEKDCVQRIMLSLVNAKCDATHFIKCADTFVKALGLPQMPSDPSEVAKQIKKLQDQGAQGQAQVCKADRDVQSCLGDQYDSCVNVDFLVSIGESKKDAQDTVELAKQLQKQCKQSSFMVNAQCDPARFDKCTDSFAKALGLPAMPTDANVLAQQIKKLQDQGEQGQIKVCKAAESLQGCLGEQYDACVNVDFLKSIGESQKDAEKFVALAKQLQKQCVQRTLFEANAQCDVAKFGQCMDTFARALGLPSMPKDPSVLDKQIQKILSEGQAGQSKVCKAAKDLQSCLGNQYDACINIDFLKSIGHTQAEAEQFVAMSKKLEKQCQ